MVRDGRCVETHGSSILKINLFAVPFLPPSQTTSPRSRRPLPYRLSTRPVFDTFSNAATGK